MIRHALGWMLAAGLTIAGPARADTPLSVALTFTGQYLPATCHVVGSPYMLVTLPNVSTRTLAEAGATAGSTMFTLSLQCDSEVTGLRVYFEGGATVDPATGNLIPQDVSGAKTAGNVQVMLSNPDGSPIRVGDRSTMKTVPVHSADPIPVHFIASYRATGPTTAGRVVTFVSYVVEVP